MLPTRHANDDSSRRSLRPPQFGLRTLLALVTACGVLLALRQWFEPIVLFAIGFFALTIFCHVVGNAIGTRLRQIGDSSEGAAVEPPSRPSRIAPQPQDFAPATHLSRRQSLGWSLIIASSIGATCGAVGGGLLTFLTARGHLTPLDVAIGVIAFSVLGGLAAFAGFAFVRVLVSAVWQALHAPANVQSSEPSSK